MLIKDLLASRNGRFTSFAIMYISEGIPYGFTSAAMVAYMRSEGVSLDNIGLFVAALFIPWSFKWAWAPLVDLFRFNKLGGRKAWIAFCTSMMLITLAAVLLLDVSQNFQWLLVFIVVNNVFAATQDVAIDSLAVSTLKADERSRGNGFMFCGQYSGIALGGAGAIALFGIIGFEATVLVMCLFLAVNLAFILLFIRDPDIERTASKGGFGKTVMGFALELRIGFFGSGPGPKLGFLFALLPVGAIALAYATLSTIQVDFGLDEAGVSKVMAMNTILAATGCVVGGILGDRFGIKRILFVAYLATAVPTLVLAFAIQSNGLDGISYTMLAGSIAAHGFVYGVAFGLHAAVFMGMANPAVGATMFTAFMAMSNIAISYTNYWQGQVAEQFDYARVLFFDAAVMLLPLLLIPFLRDRKENPVELPQKPD